jgi:hypothetical protein
MAAAKRGTANLAFISPPVRDGEVLAAHHSTAQNAAQSANRDISNADISCIKLALAGAFARVALRRQNSRVRCH